MESETKCEILRGIMLSSKKCVEERFRNEPFFYAKKSKGRNETWQY